ncbi:unnamed protein product [Brachionus calyciflorus]|uniref:Uncharacterized protein n=1 Tax=Brachionus calyciflorus TaxID=104777 RepID=A0A814QDW9_9BILA|nr:unnamed protein product [Brachionus calyciflorus]
MNLRNKITVTYFQKSKYTKRKKISKSENQKEPKRAKTNDDSLNDVDDDLKANTFYQPISDTTGRSSPKKSSSNHSSSGSHSSHSSHSSGSSGSSDSHSSHRSQESSFTDQKNSSSNQESSISISSLCKKIKQRGQQFKLWKVFESENDFNDYINEKLIHTKTTNSDLVKCTLSECKLSKEVTHNMRRIYRKCNCSKDSCKLRLRIYCCQITQKYFMYKLGEHVGKLTNLKKTRGINKNVKNIMSIILKNNTNIFPSCVLDKLINEHKLPKNILPTLKQVNCYFYFYVIKIIEQHIIMKE